MSNSANQDFSFLEQYGNRKVYRMPTCFEKSNFKEGQPFHFRVTCIYDPSKFWIVTKYQELEIFQKYLFRYYYINRNKYKVPINKIELEMYCIVFTDGGYYRAVIVGFPCDDLKEQEVQVLLIDYGMLRVIECHNVYYMNKQCSEVPQFSIRASLAGVCPRSKFIWTTDDVIEFNTLVNNKMLLGISVNVDRERQVLEIHFSEDVNGVLSTPIHKILIAQKRARFFYEEVPNCGDKSHLLPKLKYPYLFPSFEAIESGKVPSTLSDAEYQLQIGTLTSILERYYKLPNSA